MSGRRKEEETGPPEDPGGPNRGGAIPKRPSSTRSTTDEEGEGCNSIGTSSRAGGSSGSQQAGSTPPHALPTGGKGTNLRVVELNLSPDGVDKIDEAETGYKPIDSALGGYDMSNSDRADTGMGTCGSCTQPCSHGRMHMALSHDKSSKGNGSKPVEINPELSTDMEIEIDKPVNPADKRVNNNVSVIEGREFEFNRQGWARYSKELLINREGYKRKIYRHEMAM